MILDSAILFCFQVNLDSGQSDLIGKSENLSAILQSHSLMSWLPARFFQASEKKIIAIFS